MSDPIAGNSTAQAMIEAGVPREEVLAALGIISEPAPAPPPRCDAERGLPSHARLLEAAS